MSRQASHFKIGVFVLSGLVLAVLAIVLFGSGIFKSQGIIIETYVDGSVDGLDVGSEVKLRGLIVGTITEIGFVGSEYKKATGAYARYILVRMEVDPQLLEGRTDGTLNKSLPGQVAAGLRLRLISSPVTGVSFMEADFLDPEAYKPLPIDWQPREHYIPSAPSRISALGSSLERLARRIEHADIEGIVANSEQLIANLNSAVGDADVEGVSSDLRAMIEETRETAMLLREYMEKPEIRAMPESLSRTIAHSESVASRIDSELPALLTEFGETSHSLRQLSARLDRLTADKDFDASLKSLHATLENSKEATEALPDTIALLQDALISLQTTVLAQQDAISEIVRNLEVASDNVRALSSEARDYPSNLILGGPPPSLKEHE